MTNDYEQLLMLQQMTKTTGVLHEAQVLQLKIWSLVVPNANKAEFSFDFENKEIIYTIKEFSGRKPRNLDKRLKLLAKYTKDLLGAEYEIEIRYNNKRLYKSRGKKNVGKFSVNSS